MPLDIWADLREKLPAYKAEHERLGRLIAMIEGESTDLAPDGLEDPNPIQLSGLTAIATAKARPGTIGRDDFVRMSTSEAIKVYLAKMGRGNPQGPRAMARALVQGGRGDTDEETAYNNVASSLKRMKKTGEVVQVRRGEWGLSSWYAQKRPDNNGVSD